MVTVTPKAVGKIREAFQREGVNGGLPGTEPGYQVVTALGFESVEAFQQAFVPHASEIQGDVAKFTNVVPTIQISEVKL